MTCQSSSNDDHDQESQQGTDEWQHYLKRPAITPARCTVTHFQLRPGRIRLAMHLAETQMHCLLIELVTGETLMS
jgi:hypothetical protein